MQLHRLPVIELDKKLPSGHFYPTPVIINAIIEASDNIANRRMLGEVGQPVESTKIRLNYVSHLVVDLTVENGWLYADIELIKTPKGKVVNSLGINNFYLSPRGEGEVHDGKVSDGYKLIAIDLIPR